MGVDKHTGGPTYDGYSSAIVVDKDFVLRIPGNLGLAGAAPLPCAGITTWSPLRHWEIGRGSTVGVVGLGGLGHMGVKLAGAMGARRSRLDFVLDTVAAPHALDPYIGTLLRDGTLCLMGVPPEPHPSPSVMPIIIGRRSVAGSLIGGMAETQEMLYFCGRQGITSQVEVIPMDGINEAHERILKSDVTYRFVIRMGGPARVPAPGNQT
jgi:alcohol dehydrogenase (NADP+)